MGGRKTLDYLPTTPLTVLQARARLLGDVRRFFDMRGFIEVETPLLSQDTVVDQHLDPLAVTVFRDPQAPQVGSTYWLQTSPEFGMKRLLAAGAERIYQVTRAFRGGESGRHHNPEFTILEWYRVGDTAEQARAFLADFAMSLLAVDRVLQISYRDAFRKQVGLDPHLATHEQLVAAAAERGGGFATHNRERELDRDELLNVLLAACVEPQIGRDCPVILFDYPASQAALARTREGDPPVAERFELYFQGVELANGYHELLDADELLRRNRHTNRLRERDGKYQLPEHSRLLDAMRAGLPACCGVALGFDRLVMLATGATAIEQVMPFPIDRA